MRFFRRKKYGWIRNEHDPRDWNIDRLPMPRSSTRSQISLWPFVPVVLNQKSVGSCVAQSVIAAAIIDERKHGRLHVPLSVLFAYYNARRQYGPKIADRGTQIRLAIKGIQKFGCPDDKYWPYSTNPFVVNRRPSWVAYMRGISRRDITFYTITNNRTKNIKKALVNGHPVVFGTAITSNFSGAKPYIVDRPSPSDKIRGRHAMCIIGYKESPNGLLFEVLNSWGEKWGDEGRIWLTENYIIWIQSDDFTVLTRWNENA